MIADNIITVNAAIDQASAPAFNAGIEVDRGSSANTALLWNESTDKWTATNDGTNYFNLASDAAESYANSAYTQANTADGKAVTAGSYANSAYTQANTATTNALAASTYANSAFSKANSIIPGITFTANSGVPVYANVGDQWWSTTDDILYEYINDGTSNVWVDMSSSAITSTSVASSSSSSSINNAKTIINAYVFGS